MQIYHRIKDLREDTDRTQDKIAKELNMHKTTYARYESGENRVPFDFIINLANFYKVSIDYIAGRTNDKRGLTRSELSEKETDIIKKIRSLNDERRGEIIGTLNLLYKQQTEETANAKDVG